MKKQFTFSVIISIILSMMIACSPGSTITKVTPPSEPVLLNFEDKVFVTKKDFEYVYQKNNGGWDKAPSHTAEEYREYLDLYINFKRKVMEAESLGLHETDAFKKEFKGYVKQLSQPYLVEKNVQEKLIEEAYDRSTELVSASHILIRLAPDASPKDTLPAFKRAIALRDSVVKHGRDFGKMASLYSSDPSAKTNDGYLGYFKAFDMVYPFETGAYNTKKGDISMPIRSGFGYHVIKVLDKTAATGTKTAAHIIVRVGQQYSSRDTASAINRINELHERLTKGEDFAKLAADFSDDPVSAQNGGDLGAGRLIPVMEELKARMNKGEISKPFTTSFGWHILKVTDAQPLKPKEEMMAEIKSKVTRDARSNLSKEVLVNRVCKEANFSIENTTIDRFNSEAVKDANTYARGFWKPTDSLHKPLYDLPFAAIGSGKDKITYTLEDYINFYLGYRRGVDARFIPDITNIIIKKFREKIALEYEETQLPNKYPEYRELVKEYRDGILLFTLTEDKVWKKAVEDTTGLKNYFASHSDEFTANERVIVKEYQSSKKESIEEVERLIKEGKTDAEIETILNKNSALNLKIRVKTIEKGKTEAGYNLFGRPEGFQSPIFPSGDNHKIMIVQDNLPEGFKTFKEAKSECITRYQNHLESTWLAELRQKYGVQVNEAVFSQLYK